MDRKNVLIISGKDQKLTGDIHYFLRKIGLHPVDSQEYFQGGASDPYKALRATINEACAIVIVLTGDDETRLRQRWCYRGKREKELLQQRFYVPDDNEEDELELSPQPCLNVLFESGVAFATHPKKTILVKRRSLKISSFFADRPCVELGDIYNPRRKLIDILQCFGCAVDLSSNEWLNVGDFSDPEI